MADQEQPNVTHLTVQLLSAYFANNTVPSGDLAALIQTTRAALLSANEPEVPASVEFVPAVSRRQSLASRDHLISMIDGKPYKTLKRHLSTHGLTPAEYRARYKLPDDYPMVAPNYSQHRREVAKQLGLGRKPATKVEVAVPPEPPVAPGEPATTPARKTKAAKATTPVKASAPVPESPAPNKPKPARKPASKAVSSKPKAATKSPARKKAESATDMTAAEPVPAAV